MHVYEENICSLCTVLVVLQEWKLFQSNFFFHDKLTIKPHYVDIGNQLLYMILIPLCFLKSVLSVYLRVHFNKFLNITIR